MVLNVGIYMTTNVEIYITANVPFYMTANVVGDDECAADFFRSPASFEHHIFLGFLGTPDFFGCPGLPRYHFFSNMTRIFQYYNSQCAMTPNVQDV